MKSKRSTFRPEGDGLTSAHCTRQLSCPHRPVCSPQHTGLSPLIGRALIAAESASERRSEPRSRRRATRSCRLLNCTRETFRTPFAGALGWDNSRPVTLPDCLRLTTDLD